MVNATALCAVFEASLPTTQAGTVNLELYIDNTVGPLFQTKVGFGCEIDVDLDGAASVAGNVVKYFGMVTEAGLSLTPEETQTETATIKLGVSGITGLSGS
jgi:hypothetical protein